MNGLLQKIASLLQISNYKTEEPSYIWDDTVNKFAYLCYASSDNITADKPLWKVKLIDYSTTNHYSFKRTEVVVYNVAICTILPVSAANIETTLTALRVGGSFNYKKTYN